MVNRGHLVGGSPGGAGAFLRFGGGTLAHWQTAFAVELIGIEKPAGLLRGQGHFLPLLGGIFLLTGLRPERLVVILVVIAGSARRHVGSGNTSFEPLQGITQFLALVAHAAEALLHFAQTD